jgi:2-hydroxy-6-oxonona-2,4-dienedioate hydrolase
VTTYDARGFGRSACEPEQRRLALHADDLRAVLDAAGIERAAFVGQNMGGWTAMRLALEHPERVACMVLSGTAGGIVTPRAFPRITASARDMRDPMHFLGLLVSGAFERRRPELALLHRQIFSLNPPPDPAIISDLFDVRVRPEELTGFTTPTLVLIGLEDRLIPSENLREAAELLPGAKIQELRGVGQCGYIEDAATFNRVAGAFLHLHHPA